MTCSYVSDEGLVDTGVLPFTSIPTMSPTLAAVLNPDIELSPPASGLNAKLIRDGLFFVYRIVRAPCGKFHSSKEGSLVAVPATSFFASSRDLPKRLGMSTIFTAGAGVGDGVGVAAFEFAFGVLFEFESGLLPNRPQASTQKTNSSKGRIFFIGLDHKLPSWIGGVAAASADGAPRFRIWDLGFGIWDLGFRIRYSSELKSKIQNPQSQIV